MDGKQRLSIAIPSSFVSDIPHLREKTVKIGFIGRAAAIFRVDEIIIYPDASNKTLNRDAKLIATILAYVETPQYLRKYLFKISPELKYAGVLPPLRTPHHPLANKSEKLRDSEYREGVVVAQTKDGALIDVGVEKPILLRGQNLPLNKRVSVKIAKIEKTLEARLARKQEIDAYWGYEVTIANKPLAQKLKPAFDLVIATSRLGQPFNETAPRIKNALKNAKNVVVAFGAPARGLYDIARNEGATLEDFADFVVNTIPCQGTETVRTEEAIYASLALFRVLTV